MQCNPVIFKGWAWGLEGAHVRTSAALSVPVSSLKKKKKTVCQLDHSPIIAIAETLMEEQRGENLRDSKKRRDQTARTKNKSS